MISLIPLKLNQSEREDLNLRPPEPHSGALAGLRHAPKSKSRVIYMIYLFKSTKRCQDSQSFKRLSISTKLNFIL